MTSGTFCANGDFMFALSIRRLADQYRLTGLVEKARVRNITSFRLQRNLEAQHMLFLSRLLLTDDQG